MINIGSIKGKVITTEYKELGILCARLSVCFTWNKLWQIKKVRIGYGLSECLGCCYSCSLGRMAVCVCATPVDKSANFVCAHKKRKRKMSGEKCWRGVCVVLEQIRRWFSWGKKHRYRQRSSSHMGRECVGDNPLGPMKCEERSRNVIKIKVNNKTYNAARMWNWNQCHNQNHCKDTVGWLV